MTTGQEILIIDSTGNRRKELRELWSRVFSHKVVTYGGSDFWEFAATGRSKALTTDELENLQPLAGLIHNGDIDWCQDPGIKKLLGRCGRIVVFSGGGLSAKGNWPSDWVCIPRAIEGTASATIREWKQLEEWFTSGSAKPTAQIELLSPVKRNHFLIAIHILCQGFLVGERMQERLPKAVAETQKRKWWAVPLIESAGDELYATVSAEWGPDMPDSLATLVKWISGEAGYENVDLASIVPVVKQEIENRLSK